MHRCCWAKRGIFGLQIENLEEERETYPNDLVSLLATVCDRGCDITCDSRKDSYSGAHRRAKDPTRASDQASERGRTGGTCQGLNQ